MQLFRLFAGAAQRQQGDNVGFGERRLGAIVHIQPVRRACDRDIQIVIADMCGRLEVHLGLDGDRIGKGHVAAFQAEFYAIEGGIAFQNVGSAQHAGPRQRSTQTQVGIARKPCHRRLHLKFRRSLHRDVELDIVERRVCRSDRRRLAALLQIRSEIKSGGD